MCNDVGDSAHRRLAFSVPKWRFSGVNYCQPELSQNYFESNSSLFVIFLPICYKCVFFSDIYFTFYTVSSGAALGVGHIEKAGKRQGCHRRRRRRHGIHLKEEDEKEGEGRMIGRAVGTLLRVFAG